MKRKIQSIRDLSTGEVLVADELLDSLDEPSIFELRRKLKTDYRNNLSTIVCEICNSPLYLAGNVKQEHYFKHWKELGNCPIKTQGKYSQRDIDRMKYNGVKESKPHVEIKEHLYGHLSNSNEYKNVKKEAVVKSTDISGWWKKPDISFDYNSKRAVIEIQLSTTYLDVIVERETFYIQNEIYILWVFNEREISRFRFTEKDVFYDNKRNAFLVTDESKRISKERGELYLVCYYQKAQYENGRTIDVWENEVVPFTALKFDPTSYKIYYHDYNESLLHVRNKIKNLTAIEFENYWLKRDSLDTETQREKDLYFIRIFGSDLVSDDSFPFEKKLLNILSALYSIKHGVIVGFRFPNFIALSNFILEQRPEFSKIYLWALHIYGKRKEVENVESFRHKVELYKKEKPSQHQGYNSLFNVLFPELMNKLNNL
jgi:competence CoiA-like predicted nuclease